MSDFTVLHPCSCKCFFSIISLFTTISCSFMVLSYPLKLTVLPGYEIELEGIPKDDTGFIP